MYRHINKYRPIALMMAFLLLVSTSGITMDMHFCGDHLQRVNLLGKAKTCAEKAAAMKACCNKVQSTCHKSTTKSSCSSKSSHDGCCKNESIKLNLDTDLALSNVVLSDLNVPFVLSYVHVFCGFNPNISKDNIPHFNYTPPLLSRDIPILTQSFLL